MHYPTLLLSALAASLTTVLALPQDLPLVSIEVGVVLNAEATQVARLVMFDALSDSIGISTAQGQESAFAEITQPGITCVFTTARIGNDADGRIACDLDTAIATISFGEGT